MDKQTKKGLCIFLLVMAVFVLLVSIGVWEKKANRFSYKDSLAEVVLTVDDREVTLQELGYYVYIVEKHVDAQARIYNPEDPLDYWNTHFSAGTQSAYISEMARDVILETCVCDLIYESMAAEHGYTLSEEEKTQAKKEAQDVFVRMTEKQKRMTGLTQELVTAVEERKMLVAKFAAEYFEDTDFSEYSGYREELVSYDGAYYKQNILPNHKVSYNTKITDVLRVGRITINQDEKN